MKKFTLLALFALMCVSANIFASSYVNDFESETLGTMPAGFTNGQWWGGELAGLARATVVSNPYGSGQVLKLGFDNDWNTYTDNFSNGYVLGPALECAMPENAVFVMEFDMAKDNWRAWQMLGDNDPNFPIGGVHFNDGDTAAFTGWVNNFGPDNQLDNVPMDEWIHVRTEYNSGTGIWTATYSYGGNDYDFNGTSTNPVSPQLFFGGWMYRWQVERSGPDGPAGTFSDSSIYLDNLDMSVQCIPEPGTIAMFVLGLFGLAAYSRKK
mgnify:CR=1 FL=1